MNKVPRWVFRYVGNKTFDFCSKKRIFCPKTTKFSLKLAFLSIAGSFGALLVGWLGVVARAVSRKTPIYCIDNTDSKDNHNDNSDDVDNVNDSNDRYYYDQ